MEKAVLKVLKSPAITAFPNGQLSVVDIVCGGVKGVARDVIIDAVFNEYQRAGMGRIMAVKLECGGVATYVLGRAVDLRSLQECCKTSKSKMITLSCSVSGGVRVRSVLGEDLGVAFTPAEYVGLWNGSTVNKMVGELFLKNGWNFVLQYYSSMYFPTVLDCSATGGQVERLTEWGYFMTEPNEADLGTVLLSKKKPYVAGNVELNISDMPTDSYLVLRYPETEGNFTKWESGFETGTIPDFVFKPPTIRSGRIVIASRRAVTFDNTKPFYFIH